MTTENEEYLWKILAANRDRIQRIADAELRGALLGGSRGTDGDFDMERKRLIKQADAILDELER